MSGHVFRKHLSALSEDYYDDEQELDLEPSRTSVSSFNIASLLSLPGNLPDVPDNLPEYRLQKFSPVKDTGHAAKVITSESHDTVYADIPTSSKENRARAKNKVRSDWEDGETFELIMAWGPNYSRLTKASNKVKKLIWGEIWTKYKEKVAEPKSLDQVKTKMKNSVNAYKKAKDRMSTTGERGASIIKESVPFFDELDEFLGHRDNMDPNNMTISSSFIPSGDYEKSFDDSSQNIPDEAELNAEMNNRDPKGKRKAKKRNSDMLQEALDFQREVHEDNKKMRNDLLKAMETQTSTMLAGLKEIANMFKK